MTLAEPNVSITKTLTTTPVDAGDTVVYRFEVVNATGTTVSDAFDLLVVDQLNALLQIQAVTVTVGAPTVYTDTSTIGGVDVNVELSQLQPGQTAIIEVEAVVLVAAPPNAVITNTVDLTYTSLPGGGTVDNPTGSDTPGGSGDDDGERDGSDGTGGVNDYVDDSDASFTLDGYAVEKLFESSSADHTTDPFVTIGEVVTYTLVVTLPEGTMPAVVLTDTLPDGMQYVGYVLDTSGFVGTITNNPPTVVTAGGSGDDVRFEFGDIVVTANNVSADNTFSLLVSAVVLDVSGNVGYPPSQTDLDNGVALQVDDGPVVTDGPVTVTVVEPRMEIDKLHRTSCGPGRRRCYGDAYRLQHRHINRIRSQS